MDDRESPWHELMELPGGSTRGRGRGGLGGFVVEFTVGCKISRGGWQGVSGLLGWYVGLSWMNITLYYFFSYDGVGRLFVVVQLKQVCACGVIEYEAIFFLCVI